MDFFKIVFSADPDQNLEEEEEEEVEEEQNQEEQHESHHSQNPNPNSPSFQIGSTWNFGGLIKTIQSKSESVIQTYRKDLEEFSSGLKKETSVLKEVATKAVLDLPGSLETGASVAQESLESVGQALDEFGGSVWRSTNQIILQGKDAILAMENDSNEEDSNLNANTNTFDKKYSRFEMQVVGIQNDENTYIEEVESEKEYAEWIKEFEIEKKDDEIEGLIYENEKLEGFFEKLVPEVMDRETFWRRYFYKVWRLKQADDARAKLVKRVIAGEEEEELTWSDDDDDDDSVNEIEESKGEASKSNEEKKVAEETNQEEIVEKSEISEVFEDEKPVKESQVENVNVVDDSKLNMEEKIPEEASSEAKILVEAKSEEKIPVEAKSEEKIPVEVKSEEKKLEEKIPLEVKSEEKIPLEAKTEEKNPFVESRAEEKIPMETQSEHGESGKDSDFSIVSTQPSVQGEEDLEWDEIEDIGENEDKKVDRSNLSTKQADLRKRLSVAEDDEDLTWDIEDEDDEPEKS